MWLKADLWLPLAKAWDIVSLVQGFVRCSTGAPVSRNRSKYCPAGCWVRLLMFLWRLEGPLVLVTKESQEVADARRVAASSINLPSRSFRTVGRRVVFCRFVDWILGEVVGGSCGGFGFGGLAGNSVGGCRWPPRHNCFSKNPCTAVFSAVVSARWVACSRQASKQVPRKWYERQIFGRFSTALSSTTVFALAANLAVQSLF